MRKTPARRARTTVAPTERPTIAPVERTGLEELECRTDGKDVLDRVYIGRDEEGGDDGWMVGDADPIGIELVFGGRDDEGGGDGWVLNDVDPTRDVIITVSGLILKNFAKGPNVGVYMFPASPMAEHVAVKLATNAGCDVRKKSAYGLSFILQDSPSSFLQ